jgi:hypothetical protein
MLLVLLSIARTALPIIVAIAYLLNHLLVNLVVTLCSTPTHYLLTHLANIMNVLDNPMLLHVLYEALLLCGTTCGLCYCSVLDL